MLFESLLEAHDAFRIGARIDPPRQKIVARGELNVLVAEVGDLARQLLKRKMPMHVGVKRDLHRVRPCLSVCATF